MNRMLTAMTSAAVVAILAACGTPATEMPAAEPAAPQVATPLPAATTAPATPAGANAAPAIQLVPLQEGTTFTVGQEVGVAVVAADSDGIGSAGLTVDGQVVSTVQGTSGTMFQGTLMWTPTAPGQFNVGVIVYDSSGAVADAKLRQVTVLEAATPIPGGATPIPSTPTTASTGDTNPPAVSITPMETTVTVGSDVDVAVNAVDSVGVVAMALFVDGQQQDSWAYDPASGPAPQSAFETLTWRNSTEGQHEVYVTATDAAGNVGQSVTDKVTVNP